MLTMIAYTGECATRCGYPGALSVAQAAYPLVYMLAVAISSHKREWRNYVPPPSAEQVAMMQMQEVCKGCIRVRSVCAECVARVCVCMHDYRCS